MASGSATRVCELKVTLPVAFRARRVALGSTGASWRRPWWGAPPWAPGPGERHYGAHRVVLRRPPRRGAESSRAGSGGAGGEQAAPDVKFLCGDQVYLDVPTDYAETEHPREELEEVLGSTSRRGQTRAFFRCSASARRGSPPTTTVLEQVPAMRGVAGAPRRGSPSPRPLRSSSGAREPASLLAGAVSFLLARHPPRPGEAFEDFCPPTRLDAVQRAGSTGSRASACSSSARPSSARTPFRMSLSRKLGGFAHRPTIYGTLLQRYPAVPRARGDARAREDGGPPRGRRALGTHQRCKLPNGTRLVEVVSSPLTPPTGASRGRSALDAVPTPFQGLRGDVVTHRGPDGSRTSRATITSARWVLAGRRGRSDAGTATGGSTTRRPRVVVFEVVL